MSSLRAVKLLPGQRSACVTACKPSQLSSVAWRTAECDLMLTSFLMSALASSAVAYMLGYGTSAVFRAAMTLLDWNSYTT